MSKFHLESRFYTFLPGYTNFYSSLFDSIILRNKSSNNNVYFVMLADSIKYMNFFLT